jgi:hypothetical protein
MGDSAPVLYDKDLDAAFSTLLGSPSVNYYHDPIALRYDPSRPSQYTGSSIYLGAVVWGSTLYRPGGSTVYKHTMDGTADGSLAFTGSITPFSPDALFITDDELLVGLDYDNATYGVVKIYDLRQNTALHESVFDRSTIAWVDTAHNNIWSINLTSGKMQTWSFQVAPSSFSAITMGANRSRYREDALSVTLRGSVSEPCPNWPITWVLTTAEGHLDDDYSVTDASGVAANKYCGPGADDFVGGGQTITVSTGY